MKALLEKVYLSTFVVSPIIGANYAVYDSYKPGYKFGEYWSNATLGAVVGTFAGLCSPVLLLGVPAYVIRKFST